MWPVVGRRPPSFCFVVGAVVFPFDMDILLYSNSKDTNTVM